MLNKYKYFIPIIGFILMIIDTYIYHNSSLDLYYGEYLGLLLIFYCFIIHIPLIVGLGFTLIFIL